MCTNLQATFYQEIVSTGEGVGRCVWKGLIVGARTLPWWLVSL